MHAFCSSREHKYFLYLRSDGSFSTYIQAFTKLLGPVFDALFGFMEFAPPLPVQQNVRAFEEFAHKYNLPSNLYSAYPNCTVLQILGNNCEQP